MSEDLLAERGLDFSYETVRRWVLKFGPLFARELRGIAMRRLQAINWGQPNAACGLYHDFNGRYTSVCGP
jgi:hypothetical protein